MTDEAERAQLHNRKVQCPKCAAQLALRQSTKAYYDDRGFVRCKVCCEECLTFIVGIIDPFDGELHVAPDQERQ